MQVLPKGKDKFLVYFLFALFFVIPFALVLASKFFENPTSLVLPVSIILGLIVLFRMSKKKDPQENHEKAIFSCQGGGNLHGISYPFLFVRITVYKNFLIVVYGWKRFLIEREYLSEITEKRGIFGSGFTIFHRNSEVPPRLFIYPTNKMMFLAAITEAGYFQKES